MQHEPKMVDGRDVEAETMSRLTELGFGHFVSAYRCTDPACNAVHLRVFRYVDAAKSEYEPWLSLPMLIPTAEQLIDQMTTTIELVKADHGNDTATRTQMTQVN